MTRLVTVLVDDMVVEREMPRSDADLMPGVCWGDPWTVFTPAYWLTQAWMAGLTSTSSSRYRSEDGVIGELVFCLLGGFGITAELATAAYERCERERLIQNRCTDSEVWAIALREPLSVSGRMVRYRFPNQKAKFLAGAMESIKRQPLRLDNGRGLRDQLLEIRGVGYKTASWVARNVLDSDDVAILDIHLIRAGRLCRLFSKTDRVERDYLKMETRFLDFARALGLRPAALDCLIWDEMRAAGDLPLKLLDQTDETPRPRKTKSVPTKLQIAV